MKASYVSIVGFVPGFIPVPDGKGSWMSTGELTIHSNRCGMIVVPKGSHNNLASIPKPARALFSVNGPHRIAAIVHDHLYEKRGDVITDDNQPITREQADGLFYDLMKMERFKYWRALPHDMKEYLTDQRLGESFVGENGKKSLVGGFTARTMLTAVRAGGWLYWG